jgi:hypothetical protein
MMEQKSMAARNSGGVTAAENQQLLEISVKGLGFSDGRKQIKKQRDQNME